MRAKVFDRAFVKASRFLASSVLGFWEYVGSQRPASQHESCTWVFRFVVRFSPKPFFDTAPTQQHLSIFGPES